MIKEICLDMDGTFINFYSVPNWLAMLQAEDTTPYRVAKPCCSMSSLARVINNAKRHGWTVKIISWTAKNGSKEYNERVRETKKAWLRKHLASVDFDEIHIVPYGTPKSRFGNGVLFDDEIRNRDEWKGLAFDEHDLVRTIQKLVRENEED